MKKCEGLKVHSIVPIPGTSDVQVLSTPITNTNTTNNINNIQAHNVQNAQVMYNTHVYINNYGFEDLSYITKEMLDKRLKEVGGTGVAKLIIDAHFNPNKPENHNIRINSKKSKTVRVKQNEHWGIRANSDILDTLMRRYTDMLKSRLWEDNFAETLKYSEDYDQIQSDLRNIDKDLNTQKYYAIIHKILAAMEELELHYARKMAAIQ
jgi:hypothetical protein